MDCVKTHRRILALLFAAAALPPLCACAPAGVRETTGASAPVASVAPAVLQTVRIVDEPPPLSAGKAAQADPYATPDPEGTPLPELTSFTTGRRLVSGVRRPPVLAVIGNAPEVRPQTGLMQADIIYEFMLDRGDTATRLVALYSDTYPALAGPIQSARIYFFDLQREYAGMMVYNGYPDAPGYPMFNEAEIDIPAAYNDELRYLFTRDATVSSAQDNTLFCRIDELADALYGAGGPSIQPRFQFDEEISYPGAKRFSRVGLSFSDKDTGKIEFVYDGESNLLSRFERNSKGTLVQSKSLTAAGDGAALVSEPVRVQNLIVQHVRYTLLSDTQYSLALIGNGECDYFINGTYTPGYWRRDALDGPTAYYLRDGSPLVLSPGITWIAMHSDQRAIKIQFGA